MCLPRSPQESWGGGTVCRFVTATRPNDTKYPTLRSQGEERKPPITRSRNLLWVKGPFYFDMQLSKPFTSAGRAVCLQQVFYKEKREVVSEMSDVRGPAPFSTIKQREEKVSNRVISNFKYNWVYTSLCLFCKRAYSRYAIRFISPKVIWLYRKWSES